MEILHPAQEYAVLGTVATVGVKLDAYCFAPEKLLCDEVNQDMLEVAREAAGNHNGNRWEIPAGQRMMVVNVEQSAATAGLRKGDEVIVAVASSEGYNPKALIQVWVGGHVVGVAKNEIDFARCRTGHKTQGIECGVGVVGLVESKVATRRWLYTAVSRCRKRCVLVCTPERLRQCLANNPQRRTLLTKLLDKAALALGVAVRRRRIR
jgi:hypothetical protein